MSLYNNSQKARFLASIPVASIEAHTDSLTAKCKFNFAYFCVQPAGQAFSDWPVDRLQKLMVKLQDYSRESLQHWRGVPIGRKNGNVLSVYGGFPTKSDFEHPDHVPHEVEWGRFRIDYSVRLVGFILPTKYGDTQHAGTGKRFDCNTFYVVFLDADHKFYKTEAK